MELIEFILFQPPLANKILGSLSFSEILSLVDVNSHFCDAVASHLQQIQSFHIKFSKFQRSYADLSGSFLRGKSNLKKLQITLDGNVDDEAMSALCKLILRNVGLKNIHIRPYFQLSDQLLLTIGFMSKLESLEVLANGFSGDPGERSLRQFYSNIARNCRGLRQLTIKQFIDDPSLGVIASLPHLSSVDITNCDVTDVGVCKLVFSCPRLQRIRLVNAPISERSVHLIACKCAALRELTLVNPEDMNDVRALVEVLTRCRELERFKFIHEDWHLMVEFDEGSMGFTIGQRTFHAEDIVASLRERLRTVGKLRVNGLTISRTFLDVVRTTCQNLRQLFVLNDYLRSVRDSDELDESGFVVETCERNLNLATFHYDAYKLNQQACEVLADQSRGITSIRIRLQEQLSAECRTILESRFENRSRNLHMFQGERKQELAAPS